MNSKLMALVQLGIMTSSGIGVFITLGEIFDSVFWEFDLLFVGIGLLVAAGIGLYIFYGPRWVSKKYRYVAIDSNGNITLPYYDKRRLLDAIALYHIDDMDFNSNKHELLITYKTYRIPPDINFVPCSCVMNLIQEKCKSIDTTTVKASFSDGTCIYERHDWAETKMSAGNVTAIDYKCKHCKRQKWTLFFQKCDMCNHKIEPISCLKDWAVYYNKLKL